MIMRTLLYVAAPLVILASVVTATQGRAQALPAGQPESLSQGFELPHVAGTLRYSLSFSQSDTIGGGVSGGYYSSSISGDVGYVSKSDRHPFSMVASGGYRIASQGQESSPFESIALSQSLRFRRWSFVVSDASTYLPESPIPSLSGLPGLGDIGIPPVQVGNEPAQGLQSGYAPQVSNSLSGSASRSITGKTSVFGSGSLRNQFFLNGIYTGYNNHSESASVGVNHTINALTELGVNYSYGTFNYPQLREVTNTSSGSISISRRWTRAFSTSFSGGPQYAVTVGAPSSLSFQGGASLNYSKLRNSILLSFQRSVNSGAGLTTASRFNTLSLSASRRLGRYSRVGTAIAYNQTETLPGVTQIPFSGSTVVGSFQGSRSLTRTISIFGSYNLQHQNAAQNAAGINTLNGLRQTASFGVTYSPRALTVGRR